MTIISIINQKGGVGKTTLTVNLGYYLAYKNKKVLLIDMDPQAHSTIIYGSPEVQYTVSNILLKDKTHPKNLIYNAKVEGKNIPNLFLIPSNIRLAIAAEQLSSRVHREKILFKFLKELQDDYDYILIDCPPTLGVLAINCIYTSDFFLIPIVYSRYALDGVSDLFSTIDEVKENIKYNYRIVRNAYDSRTTQTNKFIETELKSSGIKLIKTKVRKSESINQAAISGKPILLFDSKSRGSEDFMSLSEEIINV